ncbi:hypothetical protein SAMN04488109_2101 [Chryseolinea serpens]|uniref:Uncharacterized protein n=1 Tax=Chryseolinea serpens TaxID=947013 RepID=A0A1M5N4B5_9BACT|nr:hypothetical protein [Chryseolinea serpens]SHG84416.1 hypothetical protein SAMN04488109_2101 [Chryseolinea serpens]
MPFIILRTACRVIITASYIFVLSMAGCKKDDDTKANVFNFDGQTRGLRSAFLLYSPSPEVSPGSGTPYYQNVFMLLSAGLTTDGHTMTGQGNAIALSVYGATQDLDIGTYTFTRTESRAEAFAILAGHVQLDNTDPSASSPGPQVFSFAAGQMIVARSGGDYTIDIAGTVEGKILKAHFTGMMTILQKN